MRYIKNYTDYILESKNNYNWSVFFLSILDYITNKKTRAKLEQLLMRDIFSNANDFLYTDDIKTYSQLPTSKKFDMIMDMKYNSYLVEEYAEVLTSIKDALLGSDADISNYKTLYDLATFADEWHENNDVVFKKERKDEGPNTDKFIEYPDGWYWINLNTGFSEDEKQNMGHCGRDDGKILFSLRDNEKQSHVTVSYNPNNKTVYQIKGRKNTKPKSIYHKYIIDMLLNDKHVITVIGTGWYKPELDFSLLDLSDDERNGILNKKPGFVYSSGMFEKYFNEDNIQMIVSMCSNGYIYEGTKLEKYSNEKEVLEFLEIINNYKIKNTNILHSIITSCCQLSSNNMRYWSKELLEYMRTFNIKCSGTILLTPDELKHLMENIGYIPPQYLLRNYVEAADFETLAYITSKQGKIKFDSAYFETIVNQIVHANDIRFDLLTTIFDFSQFELKVNMCQTGDDRTRRMKRLGEIVVANTNKKDIMFLTRSVIAFITTIHDVSSYRQGIFDIYTDIFKFDANTYKYILKELSVDGTPKNISNLTIFFIGAGIIDLKSALYCIEKCDYIDKGVVIFNVMSHMDIDTDTVLEYINTTDDILCVIQILDKMIYHNYSDLYLSETRIKQVLDYLNEDTITKEVYSNVYAKLNSI